MVRVSCLSFGNATKKSFQKAMGSAGNEGETGKGESNVSEGTKVFGAAQVSSFKFRVGAFPAAQDLPPILLPPRCRLMLDEVTQCSTSRQWAWEA